MILQHLPENSTTTTQIKWCNLGVKHPQTHRPIAANTITVSNINLPTTLKPCHCAQDRYAEHAKPKDRLSPKEDAFHIAYINHTQTAMLMATAMMAIATDPDTTRRLTQITPDTIDRAFRTYTQSNFNSNPFSTLTDKQQQRLGFTPHIATTLITEQATPAIEQYPTESRIRQKEKEKEAKEQGIELVKKKRPVTILPGKDDAGQDISQLDSYDHFCETYFDFGLDKHQMAEYFDIAVDDTECFLVNLEADLTPYHWLLGAEAPPPTPHANQLQYTCFDTFLQHWATDRNDSEHVDVVEICGGSARVSFIIKRFHRLKPGLNFDVIVGFDLLKPADVRGMWRYLRQTVPLVISLATPCTGLAGWAPINAARGSEVHHQNRQTSLQLGHLGGQIALWQLQNGRHFLAENPRGSELFKLPIYIYIRQHYPQVDSRIIDMCAAGMRDEDNGLPIKKATEILSSSPRILAAIEHLKCNNRHPQHQPIEGTCKDGQRRSHKCRIWPWGLATSVASGIAAEIRHMLTSSPQHTYPTVEIQTAPPPPAPVPTDYPAPADRKRGNRFHWPCPGCRNSYPADHPKHNRHPDDCKDPLVETVEWSCASCKSGYSRNQGRHTFAPGECRWHSAPVRPRQGKHPRDGRIPATADPTVDLMPDADNEIPNEPGSSSASGNQPPAPSDTLDYQQPPRRDTTAAPRQPQPQAPHTRDASTQDTDKQWTRFDLGRTLQLLRSANPGVVIRTLRMLHIRWWHVKPDRFKRILESAGAPESAIARVDGIIDTCRTCRMWKLPSAISVTTSRLGR